MNIPKLGTYKHSKSGELYRVIGIAKHSDTLEEFVMYEALYEKPLSKYWIRPLNVFLEDVEVNGVKVPRFKFINTT